MNSNSFEETFPFTFPISFGDFTETELIQHLSLSSEGQDKDIRNVSTTVYLQCYDKINTPHKQDVKNHTVLISSYKDEKSPNAILFGDFTEEDCAKIQLNPYPSSLIQSPPHHSLSPTTPRNYKKRYCFRCGYASHTIEKCVAVRHKTGEYIGYPYYSHSPSPSHPPSPSSSHSHSPFESQLFNPYPPEHQHLIRPGDFVFNISELRDWMVNDYEYRVDTYLDDLTCKQHNHQVTTSDEDLKIEECLYLDYLTTNLLFESQARRYLNRQQQ